MKCLSNHSRDELFHGHVRWIRRLEFRFCLKGMRFGKDLRYEFGPGCQDLRDPSNPEQLSSFVHSSLLIPHYGLTVCMCTFRILFFAADMQAFRCFLCLCHPKEKTQMNISKNV